MGLFQRAAETYDAMSHLVGTEVENQEALAPIGHKIAKATILITVDGNGKFISAEKTEIKIPIPVSEKSAGRSATSFVPHALCDKVAYICPGSDEKHTNYVNALERWAGSEFSHPKVTAILNYIKTGDILSDLFRTELIQTDEDKKIKKDDEIICWSVIGLDTDSGPVWTDKTLQECYCRYSYELIKDRKKVLCMITGENSIEAEQHLKGVVALAGNAKLISSNDTANFTFRGRFLEADEALTVGYEISQKAHNALKWLVANQGVPIGGRIFLCWNPKGKTVPKFHLPFFKEETDPAEPSDYREKLQKKLLAYRSELPDDENVIFCAFDAATSGRLSIAYYNDYKASDYLERLKAWDESCCWKDYKWGISTPSIKNIIDCAFGTQRGDKANAKFETDDKVLSQNMQRLIFCRLEKQMFPFDIVQAIRHKADNLQLYTKSNRRKLLFTACAVIQKYRFDKYREEWKMALEKDKNDRSYQYGRLLAVLDRIEGSILKERNEDRDTNALKMQAVFVRRPGYASKIIIERLKTAYYPRLSAGLKVYYDKLIGEIMEKIAEFPEQEFNAPLSETYLLGYYLQRNDFYKKNDTSDITEEYENE